MKPAKSTKMNEWLLGSTVMCPTCGCLWLVPALQGGERYHCRQCGCEVPNNRPVKSQSDSGKTRITELRQ